MSSLTAAPATQFFSMPSGYRPYSRIYAHGRGGNNVQIGMMYVEPGDDLYVYSAQTGTNVFADMEYDAFS